MKGTRVVRSRYELGSEIRNIKRSSKRSFQGDSKLFQGVCRRREKSDFAYLVNDVGEVLWLLFGDMIQTEDARSLQAGSVIRHVHLKNPVDRLRV